MGPPATLGESASAGSYAELQHVTDVVIVLAGLAASLGVIAATLPLLERITGPEVAGTSDRLPRGHGGPG